MKQLLKQQSINFEFCLNKEVGATEKEVEKPVMKHKKIVIYIIIFFCTLLFIYFGMAEYFTSHLYFGSEINAVNVSGETPENAKMLMTAELKNYTLKLKERGGKSEQIEANDMRLSYDLDDKLKKFKEDQAPLKWMSAIFTSKNTRLTVGVSYDEKLLKERIAKLSCFDSKNVIEPKNPDFKYEGNSYVILEEDPGNKVDKDILYSHVVDAIINKETEIDLDSIGAYVKPQYDSKSQKVIEVRDILNKYVTSKITYTFGEHKEVLDGSIINKWLKVDKNMNAILDEEKVKDYIAALSNTYDTIGKTRNFVTSLGNTINISGGDYGWRIDAAKETQDLMADVKEGKTVIKEPSYIQNAFFRDGSDIGNTYVEINLTKQHMWFYKNGSLLVQGDVVTGNVSSNHTTPDGVYRLKYKQRDTVLIGSDYAAPVTFWMPFNGGIGIHDASWRSVFGGDIYKTDGSHGCINSPYNVAKVIFNNIDAGTPVICY